MTDQTGILSEEHYVSDTRVAEITGLSRRFFQIARQRGSGPPFVRVSSRCVRYKWGDVEAWLKARRRRSTHDSEADGTTAAGTDAADDGVATGAP